MARVTKATARPSRTRPSSNTSKPTKPKTPYRRKSSTAFPTALPTPVDSRRRGSVFDGRNFRVFNPESPSTAISQDGRRFSDEYGHGHVLDNTAIPIKFPTGTKRRTSDGTETLSPKRVRFSTIEDAGATSTDEEQDSNAGYVFAGSDLSDEPVVDFSLARQDLALDSNFEGHPDLHLLTALRDATETLSISQISSLLQILQKLTGAFAGRYFADAINEDEESVATDMRHFPLEDLKLKHPSLYLTAVDVLDASTNDIVHDEYMLKNKGWHKFFAHPNYRPFLVSAILGEWFTQRIFKDPAFGLSAAGRKDIEDGVDKQYIYFDSFIRAKKRSAVVDRHRKMIDADNWLRKAAHELADELMIVFAPMLPFAGESDNLNIELASADVEHKAEIKNALAALIIQCAVVNLAIVRTGENGTIVRPAHRLEKGKRFMPTAPMELCNITLLMSKAEATNVSPDEEATVKMTCWPRMEAWTPHGLDLEEMHKIQHDYMLGNLPFHIKAKISHGESIPAKEAKEVQSNFCWDCSELKDNWDVLPGELHDKAREQRQRSDMLQRTYKARVKAEKAKLREAGEDDDYPSDSSSEGDDEHVTEEAEEDKETPRGSWVTEYTCLAPHQVYCEWIKPDAFYTAAIAADGIMAGKSIREVNSLENAIKEARESLPLPAYPSAQTEDLVHQLWNFYASHNLAIEWSTFLIAALVYLSRGRIIGNVGDILTLPVKLTGAILNHVSEALGMKAVSEGIAELSESNFAALNVSKTVLSNASSYVDNNLSIFKTALHNVMASCKGVLSSAQVQAISGLSAGMSTVTHFVGQRQPFTTNPIAMSDVSTAITTSTSTIAHTYTLPSNSFDSVHSMMKEPSVTLGPVIAALTSSAAAITAKITRPILVAPIDPVVVPVIAPVAAFQSEELLVEHPQPVTKSIANMMDDELLTEEPATIVPVTTAITTVFTTIDSAVEPTAAAETSSKVDVTNGRSGIWRDAASKVGNNIGEFLQGSGRGLTRTRTVTITPGQAYTTVMMRGQMRN